MVGVIHLATFLRSLAVALLCLAAPAVLAGKSVKATHEKVDYTGPMKGTPTGRFSIQAETVFAKTGNFNIDTNNRQHVQAFFNSVYAASEKTPLAFSGSVGDCAPSRTSRLFQDAVRLRINWFRELAGVADSIVFRDSYNAAAQDAALIMAANGLLTHTPANSLTCYTSTGDQGAGSSNLALGSLGWDSITGYMEDSGSNNAAVGHRRWLLHPPTLEMGTGDVLPPQPAPPPMLSGCSTTIFLSPATAVTAT